MTMAVALFALFGIVYPAVSVFVLKVLFKDPRSIRKILEEI